MEHVARFLALSIVFVINNTEISERSEQKFFKVMLKVHKKITENVYSSDFRGGGGWRTPVPPSPKSASESGIFHCKDKQFTKFKL